ncbi:MAG: CCA tRNA nucleotidyltransferase [Gemmatimonadales bacterium]|nr:MAG: CCA tRNA nucleotidyltransferase [Gemmatimonadales bacterium]
MSGASPSLNPPDSVRWVVRTLEDAGHETWAVGGAVRDALAGRVTDDWDLTTRARPREVQRLFRRTVPIGIDHGTVGVLDREGGLHEVTTFRRDVETTGRHAVVAFADRVEEDLARRDFTINAVAWHPLRDELLDPWDGAGDLARRRLRTVGVPEERFAEDYLRILRGLRFAGRFRLEVEPATWRALCRAVPGMEVLSRERIREELEKSLADREAAAAILSLQAASGALRFLHPEWRDRIGERVPEGGDRWARALRAVEWAGRGTSGEARIEDRLSVLLAQAVHPGESDPFEAAVLASVAFLDRLRSSRARARRVAARAGGAAAPPALGASGLELRRWLARVGREEAPGALRVLSATLAARAVRALPGRDGGQGGAFGEARRDIAHLLRALRRELRSGVPLATDELAVTGRDLIRQGHRPGPAFGTVLDTLLQEVLADPERNREDVLLLRADELLRQREDGR